jgi:hypothetical protein
LSVADAAKRIHFRRKQTISPAGAHFPEMVGIVEATDDGPRTTDMMDPKAAERFTILQFIGM